MASLIFSQKSFVFNVVFKLFSIVFFINKENEKYCLFWGVKFKQYSYSSDKKIPQKFDVFYDPF